MLTQAGASPWKIAVIGAGPAGLALALQAGRWLPHADISLFDARAADQDISADPRTLALALGSVQTLQRPREVRERRGVDRGLRGKEGREPHGTITRDGW